MSLFGVQNDFPLFLVGLPGLPCLSPPPPSPPHSDGGHDQDSRIIFVITMVSEDLTELHMSLHKVQGGPKDSGREELAGIIVIIIYLCQIITWYDRPKQYQNNNIP